MPRSSGRSGGGRSRSYSTSARPQTRPTARNTARSYSSGTKTQARPSASNSARAPPAHKAAPSSVPSKKEAPKPEPKQAAPSQPAPQTQHVHYSSGGNGFFSNMAQGFAFGAGSAVAHNAVNGVVNAVTGRGKDVQRDDNAPVETESVEQTQMQDPNDPCSMQRMDFNSCLEMNKENVTECQLFFDSFKRCQERYQDFNNQNMNRYE